MSEHDTKPALKEQEPAAPLLRLLPALKAPKAPMTRPLKPARRVPTTADILLAEEQIRKSHPDEVRPLLEALDQHAGSADLATAFQQEIVIGWLNFCASVSLGPRQAGETLMPDANTVGGSTSWEWRHARRLRRDQRRPPRRGARPGGCHAGKDLDQERRSRRRGDAPAYPPPRECAAGAAGSTGADPRGARPLGPISRPSRPGPRPRRTRRSLP